MKLWLFGKEKGRSIWLTIACDGFQWHAMAYDRIQSHTVALVSDSEDEAEHLDDAPRYQANHREDGMSYCIEQHEEETKYHHSTNDFRFNLRPLQRPDSTYKVTKKFWDMQLSEPLSSSHSALFQAIVAFILAIISMCRQNFLNLQKDVGSGPVWRQWS